MKIRAINRVTGKQVILEFDSIEEAIFRNPYFKEFIEISDSTEYEETSYKNIYGDIE